MTKTCRHEWQYNYRGDAGNAINIHTGERGPNPNPRHTHVWRCPKCMKEAPAFLPEEYTQAMEQARQEERGRADDLIRELQDWADAYPIKVFQEPDLELCAAVLESRGLSLDSISASNMRHVLKGVKEIIANAIRERGGK